MLIKHALKTKDQTELENRKNPSQIDCKPGQIIADPEYCFSGLKVKDNNYINYY